MTVSRLVIVAFAVAAVPARLVLQNALDPHVPVVLPKPAVAPLESQ